MKARLVPDPCPTQRTTPGGTHGIVRMTATSSHIVRHAMVRSQPRVKIKALPKLTVP